MPPKPVIRKATFTPDLGEAVAVFTALCGIARAVAALVIGPAQTLNRRGEAASTRS